MASNKRASMSKTQTSNSHNDTKRKYHYAVIPGTALPKVKVYDQLERYCDAIVMGEQEFPELGHRTHYIAFGLKQSEYRNVNEVKSFIAAMYPDVPKSHMSVDAQVDWHKIIRKATMYDFEPLKSNVCVDLFS